MKCKNLLAVLFILWFSSSICYSQYNRVARKPVNSIDRITKIQTKSSVSLNKTLSLDTFYVPTDYAIIQDAISVAEDGAVIIIEEGFYEQQINFTGKAITVASRFYLDDDTSHISKTIIDGTFLGSANNASLVYFNNGEDSNSVLCGLTLQNGAGTYGGDANWNWRVGGAIAIEYSGATIKNNIINNNTISSGTNLSNGAGIDCFELPKGNMVTIEDNSFLNNKVNGEVCLGGAISFENVNGTLVINKNIITNCSVTGTNVRGGGIRISFGNSESIKISNNIIKKNISEGGISKGGGIHLSNVKAEITNNLLTNNSCLSASSGFGGGVSIGYSSDYPTSQLLKVFVANNTIVNNNAQNKGSGIYIDNIDADVINNIIRGNEDPLQTQISINGTNNIDVVEYSNIEGGFDGLGNINMDPQFLDTTDYYLSPSSPCIDAGNPDSYYNDIEDPSNPGFALTPAMGTLRNDMGTYGGNPSMSFSVKYSPIFQAFLDSVYSVTSEERQTLVNSFKAGINQFPFVEDEIHCYFIYSGFATNMMVVGDMNSWDAKSTPMQNISGTDFWFRHYLFDSDARIDYKYIKNGSWILDPLNPLTCTGGFGPNSELAMPDYIQPTEIEYRQNIPHGSIQDTTFISSVLNNSRSISVYTPPNYDDNMAEGYPVILLHDGKDYIKLGYAINVIDYLISEDMIEPIIAVFVPPVNREAEYATTKTAEFSSFIINELMPFIDSKYKTSSDPMRRAMIGVSYGGLISTQICYQNPENFGLCAPFSPSYWANNMSVFNEVVNGPKKDIKFYVDWGSLEGLLAYNSKLFVNELETKEYEVKSNEWHEGHSWGSWRAHLDIALEYFFPGSAVSVEDILDIPSEYQLSQNYPNPFNPSTTIKYQIPKQVRDDITNVSLRIYDILGREVATLVNEKQKPGFYEVLFNPNDLASGIYFYKLQAGASTLRQAQHNGSSATGYVETKKMIYLK